MTHAALQQLMDAFMALISAGGLLCLLEAVAGLLGAVAAAVSLQKSS